MVQFRIFMSDYAAFMSGKKVVIALTEEYSVIITMPIHEIDMTDQRVCLSKLYEPAVTIY